MKKLITLIVLVTFLSVLAVQANVEYKSVEQYYYIGKCDKVEFIVRFLDGKPRGSVTLISPLSVSYYYADKNYKVDGDKIIYTFDKPVMGKWNMDLYAIDLNNVKIEVKQHNLIGTFDEQHDVPLTTSPQEYQMRAIYDTLDTFQQAQIEAINSKFTDMTPAHWASPYVAKLHHVGIVGGYGDKTFKPAKETKAAEFIKMVICAMGYDIQQSTAGYWAQLYIDKAIELRLIEVNEYSSYEAIIKREQAARIMVRATGIKEALPDNNLIMKIHEDIMDYKQISDYYKTEVATSYAIGIITGIDGYFKPMDSLTRAQACTVIMRYIDDTMRSPYVPVSLRNVRTMTLQDGNGKPVTIYPPKHEIVLDAAFRLDEARRLTKGADTMEYNGDRISSYFFSSVEDKAVRYGYIDPFDMRKLANKDMFIELRLVDEYSGIISYSVIYNPSNMKKYHYEVIIDMFKFWFGNDYVKVQSEFDNVINKSGKGESGTKKITCNNRIIIITYDGSIGIRIYRN